MERTTGFEPATLSLGSAPKGRQASPPRAPLSQIDDLDSRIQEPNLAGYLHLLLPACYPRKQPSSESGCARRKHFLVRRDGDSYVTRTGPNQLAVPSRLTALIR